VDELRRPEVVDLDAAALAHGDLLQRLLGTGHTVGIVDGQFADALNLGSCSNGVGYFCRISDPNLVLTLSFLLPYPHYRQTHFIHLNENPPLAIELEVGRLCALVHKLGRRLQIRKVGKDSFLGSGNQIHFALPC